MLEMRVIFLVAIAIDNIIGNTKNTHFSSSGLRAKKPFFLKTSPGNSDSSSLCTRKHRHKFLLKNVSILLIKAFTFSVDFFTMYWVLKINIFAKYENKMTNDCTGKTPTVISSLKFKKGTETCCASKSALMCKENVQNPSEAKHSCIFNAFLLFIQAPAFFLTHLNRLL
jgi:hypothetical protein